MKPEVLYFLVSSSQKLPYMADDLRALAERDGVPRDEWDATDSIMRHAESHSTTRKKVDASGASQ